MIDVLKINVNEHTEKKGGLTYLSWAWAWAEVLRIDPKAYWEPMDFNAEHGPFQLLHKMDDGTAFVGVSVRFQGMDRRCMLPVMDNRNKAISKPNAFDVNKAQMRCLAKAIAMHGLGLYIYAGEDLPEGAPEPTPEGALEATLEASIEQAKQKRQGVMGAVLEDIHLDDMTKQSLSKLAARIAPMPPSEAYQVIEDNGLEADEKLWLWSLLDSKMRSALKRERETRSLTKEPA